MRVTIALLALVSCALATYEIDSPNASEGWVGTRKQQTVTWTKASDDPSVINVKIVNPGLAINKILASGIEGNTGEHHFDPPNGGWTTGSGYLIVIEDNANQGVTLGQSPAFTIGETSGGKNDA